MNDNIASSILTNRDSIEILVGLQLGQVCIVPCHVPEPFDLYKLKEWITWSHNGVYPN